MAQGVIHATLVDSMASDAAVVRSARVSTLGDKAQFHTVDTGLINYLMRNKHASPFEHNSFTWLVHAPIFVTREIIRHRIASYNEESGRYRELEPQFYLPANRPLRQIGKTGDYQFEDAVELQPLVDTAMTTAYNAAWQSYQTMLDAGVAKEVARMVLPVGIFSSIYVTMNARALMNFLSLRTAPNAQYEIRVVAEFMEQDFARLMPMTYNAWVANGRQSV
jgi:thymidylate synthase (FAD)